jgi:hypothetical protein
MKLYIANPTRQIREFQYRVLEDVGVRVQKVPIGGQIPIAGDLNTIQIDDIIKQHRKYGLVDADQVKSHRDFIASICSVGKPVPAAIIQYAMEQNRLVLVRRGKKQRELMAVAANNVLESNLAENNNPAMLDKLEVTVEELENRNSNEEREGGLLSEGLRVTRSTNPDGSPLAPAPKPKKTRKKKGS